MGGGFLPRCHRVGSIPDNAHPTLYIRGGGHRVFPDVESMLLRLVANHLLKDQRLYYYAFATVGIRYWPLPLL